MSRAELDLVAALRAEIAAVDPSRPCDRLAESAGLDGSVEGRRTTIGRLLVRLRRAGTGDVPTDIDWGASADHCRTAWLRGRFLSRGSLSLAGGRSHLEFVVEADEAAILARRLVDAGLPASWRLRRGRGVVTSKSSDAIATFLRRIGGGGALLELEARQVSRALRGELNRILNAESANLHRAVGAAGRHLAAIALLESDGRLAEQPYVVRLVAEARRETPEATLTELAERLSIHRSAIQRALERLERLALHGDDGGPAFRARRMRVRGPSRDRVAIATRRRCPVARDVMPGTPR
ncbi:MAG TPA: DNA-binding protein WhiA [Candidatus Limnocylindrales bacterium]|nr:DNA-binding protein WhiA [Candidatus Limnocylindrales bacterium]